MLIVDNAGVRGFVQFIVNVVDIQKSQGGFRHYHKAVTAGADHQQGGATR